MVTYCNYLKVTNYLFYSRSVWEKKKVCGSNGVTYSSLCELKRHSCRDTVLITVRHHGNCTDGR